MRRSETPTVPVRRRLRHTQVPSAWVHTDNGNMQHAAMTVTYPPNIRRVFLCADRTSGYDLA